MDLKDIVSTTGDQSSNGPVNGLSTHSHDFKTSRGSHDSNMSSSDPPPTPISPSESRANTVAPDLGPGSTPIQNRIATARLDQNIADQPSRIADIGHDIHHNSSSASGSPISINIAGFESGVPISTSSSSISSMASVYSLASLSSKSSISSPNVSENTKPRDLPSPEPSPNTMFAPPSNIASVGTNLNASSQIKRGLEADSPQSNKKVRIHIPESLIKQEQISHDNYSPGDQGPSGSTTNGSPSTSRRHAHILSEQRRRESINGGFQLLKNTVPFCKGTQDSKAMILKKAAEYILSLEQELSHYRYINSSGSGLQQQHPSFHQMIATGGAAVPLVDPSGSTSFIQQFNPSNPYAQTHVAMTSPSRYFSPQQPLQHHLNELTPTSAPAPPPPSHSSSPAYYSRLPQQQQPPPFTGPGSPSAGPQYPHGVFSRAFSTSYVYPSQSSGHIISPYTNIQRPTSTPPTTAYSYSTPKV